MVLLAKIHGELSEKNEKSKNNFLRLSGYGYKKGSKKRREVRRGKGKWSRGGRLMGG